MIFRKRRQALYHEPNTLEAVAQYHHLFQLPIPASPSLPSNERFQLQISLLQEEIGRLKTAIERKRSLATVAKTFANLQYAIGGSVLEFGTLQTKQQSTMRMCIAAFKIFIGPLFLKLLGVPFCRDWRFVSQPVR